MLTYYSLAKMSEVNRYWKIYGNIKKRFRPDSRPVSVLFFLAAAKQLYEWFSTSVHLSVCLSHLFPSSYHHEIFRSYYQWQKRGPCKRSRSKVKITEVKTKLSRFRTVIPVLIDIWRWNGVQSLMWLRRGALFFKVIREISGSHG